jgi:hypothetical protein
METGEGSQECDDAKAYNERHLIASRHVDLQGLRVRQEIGRRIGTKASCHVQNT